MWQRHSYFSYSIFALIIAFCPRESPAIDIYQTLSADAKKLKRPNISGLTNFDRLSSLQSDNQVLGLDQNLLRTPEQKQDFAKLSGQLADKSYRSLVTNGISLPNGEEDLVDTVTDVLSTESVDPDAPAKNDDNDDLDDDNVEGSGIISVLRSNTLRNVYSLTRPHTKQTSLLPMFQTKLWQDMRREQTLKLTEANDDFLADRPLTEFCTEDAGRGLPTSAVLQFSIFDIGIAETSGSSLDLALLHLLEQPDVFRIVPSKDDSVSDEIYGEFSWQSILIDWQADLKNKKRKLSDLAVAIKQLDSDIDVDGPEYKFALALSELAKEWSGQCTKAGGRWLENQTIRKAKAEWLIAECQVNSAPPLFRIVANDNDVEHATVLSLFQRQGNLVATTQLLASDVDHHSVLFYVAKPDEQKLSATLVFDQKGNLRERIGNRSIPDHFAWTAKGELIWSGRQNVHGHWVEDITWDTTGKPRAQFFFDHNGAIISLAEWYADYKPASVTHFTSEHREGLQQWWHDNGKLAGDSMWSYGKRLGTSRIQFEQGTVGFDASYINDQLDGMMYWRDENGHEVMRANFKNGLVEGSISLKSDGKTELASAKFDHGMAEGDVRFGQPGVQPTVTFPFKSGILDGIASFYTVKHALRMQVPFRSGKIDGELKAFYGNGSKAAECKFDSGHLLSWNSWPKKNDPHRLRIEGKVLDSKSTRMTQTLYDDAKKISAACDGREGSWHQCAFTVKGKSYTISDDELAKAVKEVRFNNAPYNINKCGQATQIWNLSPWVDSGSVSAAVELTPPPKCNDAANIICKVAVTNRLQVGNCELFVADSEDGDHDHE